MSPHLFPRGFAENVVLVYSLGSKTGRDALTGGRALRPAAGAGLPLLSPLPPPPPPRASPGAGWGASTAHAHSSQSQNLEVWDEGRVGLSRGLSPWLADACLSSCHSLSWLCNTQILISQERPVTNVYFFAHVTSWFWASCSRGLWVPAIVGLRLKKQLELGSCFPHDTGKRSVTKSHSVPRGGTRHMV